VSIEAWAANIFDLFKDLERRDTRYDLIILDHRVSQNQRQAA
jgi:23S rRNA G2069 N7-methylase RlmK/C1962 C5-methylase RlmI